MDRRKFIRAMTNVVAAGPLAAFAQPASMPVIGFLSSLGSSERASIMPAFHKGLQDMGYVEGRNLAIEYRWAEGQYGRLPALAADLVSRHVLVIAAISGTPAALAARAATAAIPIVFAVGSDPVAEGLVTSLSRPSGNVTGVTFFTAQMGTKRMELLRELPLVATTIALLVNPNNPASASEGARVQAAARAIGQRTSFFGASTEEDIDRAFAALMQQRIGAVLVSADPFFLDQRNKLVALAAAAALPAIYADREYAEAGGLLTYGGSRADAYRKAGIYVGRILKGDKPSNLPIIQPTTFELVVNLKTAKSLGLTIPQSLLLRADEVIK